MPTSWLQQLSTVGREVGRGMLELFYPACCHVCALPLSPSDRPICTTCRNILSTDPTPTCPRCAASVGPFAVIDGRCSRCREESLPFDTAVRLGCYDGP